MIIGKGPLFLAFMHVTHNMLEAMTITTTVWYEL